MNKTELVAKISEKTNMTKKDTAIYVEAMLETISNTLAEGDKVQLVGFGTFEVRDRKERQGRNPQTGEVMTISASKAPAFKAGKTLKDAVNGR